MYCGIANERKTLMKSDMDCHAQKAGKNIPNIIWLGDHDDKTAVPRSKIEVVEYELRPQAREVALMSMTVFSVE